MEKAGTIVRLECRHIQFCYPGASAPILDDLSLVLEQPGLHGLFGPSGVGKTSLARIISGLCRPATGQVVTQGLQTILYCHNLERLPGWSGAGRHLDRVTPGHNAALKDALIEQFRLTDCLHRRFSKLSLGQRNRVNLVRYLVQDLQMLIMDESLANVDEHTRSTILVAIKAALPQACFLYISHNIVEVARFCDRIWVLRDRGKRPQAVSIQGLDSRTVAGASSQMLEKTMLEMMNAA
jgi:ABC-type multidrug transport system ATPase subunit